MVCLGVLLASSFVLAETPAPSDKRPAVLFTGVPWNGMSFEVTQKLSAAGFNVDCVGNIDGHPLTWEQVQKYNVIVVWRPGDAKADNTLTEKTRQNIDVLNKFNQAGGGLLIIPSLGQSLTEIPVEDALLKPMGITLLYDELPVDSQTSIVATAWKIPFAYADVVTASPVTEGIKGLWYPAVTTRPGGQNHAMTFQADSKWTTVLSGSKSSATVKAAPDSSTFDQPGTLSRNVPLVAIRADDKSRAMIYGITAEYLYGGAADTTLENIVLLRGFEKTPSQGYQLLENGLKWLAEPSFTAGTLGGAATNPKLLIDPKKTQFATPWDWTHGPNFPTADGRYPGVIGARTTYSSGKATPEEWVTKAKAQGLSYLVFLEEFSKLSPENFEKLKADCVRLSTDDFTALPGFTIDDEVGNHYFYFGSAFPYPKKESLSVDGKVFRSHDTGLDPKKTYIPGQLAMTTLDYAYTLGSFKLTAGNYFFKDDPIPFVNFFSNWDAIGVVTRRDGEMLEDARPQMLTLAHSGQGPMPLAIDLMSDPAQLAVTPWRTVLRLPSGHPPVAGVNPPQGTKIRDYFSEWHLFPDDPSRLSVTSGPEIEDWSFAGPRDYEGHLKGDYVWQNYRWFIRGKVSSDVGLAEVAVYDGPKLFRRFLPNGEKTFEFQMELNHNQQHYFIMVATDVKGHFGISGEQIDRNQRLEEFQCSDRNNELLYSYNTNKQGYGVHLGGNGGNATPNKRLFNQINPAGTFGQDQLMGTPAFDGGPSGDSPFFDDGSVLGTSTSVPNPCVLESDRLLNSFDVEMGEGKRENIFAGNIRVANVWHTLWRTLPVKEYSVTVRNCYVQTNPDSPLGVYLMDIAYKLKQDLPNKGFKVGMLASGESALWTWRDSAFAVSGNWEKTRVSESRDLKRDFDPGAYVGFLNSPLGGVAVFSMTKGLQAQLGLPMHGNLNIELGAEDSPQKKGEEKNVRLLFLGIPRQTPSTASLPASTTEVAERFYHEFNLDGGEDGYKIDPVAGTVIDRHYLLAIDGKKNQAFSGVLTGKLISTLPITVAGLNDNWSAYLYDRTLKQARPLGMFENKAWATVCLEDRRDIFIGHPIVADNPDVFIQVTQSDDDIWSIEAHNPTDKPIETTLSKNTYFDPLKDKPFSEHVILPPGSSIHRQL